MTTETVSATSLTKAERLAIGGAVAPIVRRAADAPRRVTIINKDGSPVGVTDSVNVAQSMLARADIEFSVQEGKRPEWVKCKTCGAPVKVGKGGRARDVCRGVCRGTNMITAREIEIHDNTGAVSTALVTRAIRTAERLTSTERLVLLVVASHIDGFGEAWPSVPKLAAECGLTTRTVERTITALVSAGWLVRESAAGPMGTNVYRVTPRHGAIGR